MSTTVRKSTTAAHNARPRDAILAGGGNLTNPDFFDLSVVASALAQTVLRYAAMFGNVRLVIGDYDVPLASMIAAGRYDYVNKNITAANFPITGTGKIVSVITLVSFHRDIGSDDAVAELAYLGFEPARIEHACAFGAQYPDVQRKFPIVFLGSVWEGPGAYRGVPCLLDWHEKRGLDLGYWGRWSRDDRFAAVRKVLPTPAL